MGAAACHANFWLGGDRRGFGSFAMNVIGKKKGLNPLAVFRPLEGFIQRGDDGALREPSR
jgi:hypothetical protein